MAARDARPSPATAETDPGRRLKHLPAHARRRNPLLKRPVFCYVVAHWLTAVAFFVGGFVTDFSSVNGWPDPLTNLVYKPIARRPYRRRASA